MAVAMDLHEPLTSDGQVVQGSFFTEGYVLGPEFLHPSAFVMISRDVPKMETPSRKSMEKSNMELFSAPK